MKELQFLVDAGYGKLLGGNAAHPQFDEGVWEYDSELCGITIFRHGLIFTDKKKVSQTVIDFREAQNVKSFLNAKVLSEISMGDNTSVCLPLQITTQRKQYELDIPLVLYSAILITIQRLISKNK